VQLLALVSTTFRISSHYSISQLTHKMEERVNKLEENQKRKFSEIDGEFSDIGSHIRALHKLEVDMYDIKRELEGDNSILAGATEDMIDELRSDMEDEFKSIRRGMEKMNEKMEGMWRYSLNSFRINSAKADPQYDFNDWMLHVPGSPPTIWSDEE